MLQSELDQFCTLAEKQRGMACTVLLKDVFKHDKIYVFGELFKVSSIKQLKDNNDFVNSFNTLELFAYGTYLEYKNNRQTYIELTIPQIRKLKLLSLVTLTFTSKIIPYSVIQSEIDITDIRELEDIIIEAIYKKLITAKLDQRNRIIRVTDSISRDIPPHELENLIHKLVDWRSKCHDVAIEIEKSSSHLKSVRLDNQKLQSEVQDRAEKTKQSLKVSNHY